MEKRIYNGVFSLTFVTKDYGENVTKDAIIAVLDDYVTWLKKYPNDVIRIDNVGRLLRNKKDKVCGYASFDSIDCERCAIDDY